MFSRRKIPKKDGEGENPFLLTFSDFMASLLAIFILVLIVTLIELEKKKAAVVAAGDSIRMTKERLITSLRGIRTLQSAIGTSMTGVSQREVALTMMLNRVKSGLEARGVHVVLAENGTVLRIPEQQLQFALGKYEIPSVHFGSAKAIGQALLEALSDTESQTLLDTVFIEGHTDSVSNPREMGNWGLSTYRAISLWNFWTERPGELVGLKYLRTRPPEGKGLPKPLVSVSGYADTRSTHGALGGQMSKSDRSEDRRIDIRFTLASSEKQSLEKLQEHFMQLSEKTDQLLRELDIEGAMFRGGLPLPQAEVHEP